MRTLFWNIFLAFWLAMVLIIVATVVTTFNLTRQEAGVDELDRRDLMGEVAEAVEANGIAGFDEWLKQDGLLPSHMTVYLINERGEDALGRRIPPNLERQWRRVRDRFERRGRRNQRENSRRSPNEFVAPDGERYRPMLGRLPPPVFGVLGIPRVAGLVLLFGVLISAAICWWLSRYLSAPITHIARATELLADGRLSARVGEGVYRADELGALASRFDRMADELERNERGRRDLLRNISHELRTPLARMRVALELARRSPERTHQHLERIDLETTHIDRLIGQVLELARMQYTSNEEGKRFSLAQLLQRLVADAQFEGKLSSKTLRLTLPGEALDIHGHEDVLASAFENIIRNALAHTPEDTEVTVAVARPDDGLSVQICDQGAGVGPGHHDRLFEPFYREEENTRPGAGVGLAITAQAIKAHGGTVEAKNGDERGLCVTVTLPASLVRSEKTST